MFKFMDIALKFSRKSPFLPPLIPEKQALFLDIDGTLLDIADSADSVIVPKNLENLLQKIFVKFSGAVALISGRSIKNIQNLFHLSMPMAGLHGGEFFFNNHYQTFIQPCQQFSKAKAFIYQKTENYHFFNIEDKDQLLALHYRLSAQNSPFKEKITHLAFEIMEQALNFLADSYTLQAGKYVIELKPKFFDKGKALHQFMQRDPFKNRIPIAIGDDLTDEAMFEETLKYQGFGIMIGPTVCNTKALYHLPFPKMLRNYLASTLLCHD